MKTLIYLEDAIDAIIKKSKKAWDTLAVDECRIIEQADAVEALMKVPSAEPERKTGKWLIKRFGADAQCSECGTYFSDAYDTDNSDAFCRHCGAKMDGLKEDEQ